MQAFAFFSPESPLLVRVKVLHLCAQRTSHSATQSARERKSKLALIFNADVPRQQGTPANKGFAVWSETSMSFFQVESLIQYRHQ